MALRWLCVSHACLRSTYFFFFNDTATTEIYPLSLHDALPISPAGRSVPAIHCLRAAAGVALGTNQVQSAPSSMRRRGWRCTPAAMHMWQPAATAMRDRKSTRLNSSHDQISYAVFCLKKKKEGQHATRLSQRAVERERLGRGLFGSLIGLGRRHRAAPLAAQLREGHRDAGMCQGILGVLRNRLLEILDASADPRLREFDETMAALEIELVGLEIAGGLLVDPGSLIGGKLRLQRGRDLQRHVRLNREDIGQLTVVRLRPEVLIAVRVDELRDDPHPVAGAADAPLEQGGHA